MAIIKTNRSVRLNGLNPLAYIGQNSYTPPDYVIYQRDPTVNDWQDFYVGCIWLNQIDPPQSVPGIYNVWMLVSKSNNQGKWIQFAGGTGDVLSLSGNTGTNPVFPIAGNIKVFGDGTTINISGDGINTLTASLINSGTYATSFVASAPVATPTVIGGTAVPISQVINVQGSHNISVSAGTPNTGAGNDIVYWLNNTVTLGDLANITAGNFALNAQTGDITLTANNSIGNINLVNTVTGGTAGVITLGGTGTTHRFMHNYPGANQANTFVGFLAGNTVVTLTGQNCAGFGTQSLQSLTSGSGNCGFGPATLDNCTTGGSNTALGYASLNDLTTSSFNSSVGNGSGQFLLTGHDNCFLGYDTGTSYTTSESNNILIGSSVSGTATESNICRIGSGTGSGQGNLSKTFISGIRGVTTDAADAIAVLISSTGQLGTVSSSMRYKENIHDMETLSNSIMDLRPVTFNYKDHTSKKIQFGLIAEEVANVFPDLVVYNEDNLPESVKYHELPAIILNELQKLYKRIELLEKNS